uniref:Transposase Tnp1/En/Spm-like domain-containing protein n=1 Tax=Cannabis sativa TaxID=3483 RepID=A0A803P451_CANSA
MHMFGFGVCPLDEWKDKSTWKRNQNKYVDALESKVDDLESQVENLKAILNNQSNGNDIPTAQDINATTSLDKETRRQLWFSSSPYDTPVVEAGEVVNIKSITSEPELIAIGIVRSKHSSKKVGGEELGSFLCEVTITVLIKPNELLFKLYGPFKTIREAVGKSIAWPMAFVRVLIIFLPSMASSSGVNKDLEQKWKNICLDDEEENEVVYQEEDVEEIEFDDRWCLVGRLLTGKVSDFMIFQNIMADLWKLEK